MKYFYAIAFLLIAVYISHGQGSSTAHPYPVIKIDEQHNFYAKEDIGKDYYYIQPCEGLSIDASHYTFQPPPEGTSTKPEILQVVINENIMFQMNWPASSKIVIDKKSIPAKEAKNFSGFKKEDVITIIIQVKPPPNDKYVMATKVVLFSTMIRIQ